MKNVLLCLIIILPYAANAQQTGFQNKISLSTAINDDVAYFGIEYVAGYKLNQHLTLGIGTGLTDIFAEGAMMATDDGYSVSDKSSILVPLFIEAMVNITKSRVSPFVLANIGYYFDTTSDSPLPGLLFRPSVGLDFKIGSKQKWSIYFLTGAFVHKFKTPMKFDKDYGDYKDTRVGLELKMGFCF